MKTYFFEKENGEVFGCEAIEADQVRRDVNRRYKLIGVSDGNAYKDVMKEWKPKQSDIEEEQLLIEQEYAALQKRALEAEITVARGHIEFPPDLTVTGDAYAIGLVKHGR